MTLTAENLHSTVNKKQSTQTLVQYAQSFSAERWYPVPETVIQLHDLNFPARGSCTKEKFSSYRKRDLREWASINGAVVRQRSCRQESRHSTQNALYFKELTPIQDPAGRPSKNPHPDDVEEISQYESESDDMVMMEVRLTTHLFTLTRYKMLRLF